MEIEIGRERWKEEGRGRKGTEGREAKEEEDVIMCNISLHGQTIAMHLVVFPFALIMAPILPSVYSCPTYANLFLSRILRHIAAQL